MSMNYSAQRDDSFTADDSPVIIEVAHSNVLRVMIMNYGAGSMIGQASIDGGDTYGDEMLILGGTAFETVNMSPTHIKFTHVADTSWQVYTEGM